MSRTHNIAAVVEAAAAVVALAATATGTAAEAILAPLSSTPKVWGSNSPTLQMHVYAST